MLPRVLEPEVMDSPEEARDYNAMDHGQVNRAFVEDFLAHWGGSGRVLDVGTGTAQIPIELCRRHSTASVVAVDLAASMIRLGEHNVAQAGLRDRIQLQLLDAKQLPFADGAFSAVMSNSIVHHIPLPGEALAEMVRVTSPQGLLFVRDLLRPERDAAVRQLVDLYAADASVHQRAMFEASLRAALTLEEIRDLVVKLGFPAATVQQTTDRHWTWRATK